MKTELNKEEQILLEKHRKQKETIVECSEQIANILEKYNTYLTVDPTSPINNIRVIVQTK